MKKRKGVHLARESWVKLVAMWQQSGQSQGSFAEAQGVNLHTLRSWVYKLRDEAQQARRCEKPAFVEVHAATPKPPPPGYRLLLGEELVLELPELPPATWVRDLC